MLMKSINVMSDNPMERVKQITSGHDVDVVIEAVGPLQTWSRPFKWLSERKKIPGPGVSFNRIRMTW